MPAYAETLWLAAHGWDVTAVDFSASALAHLGGTADALGPEIAQRVTCMEGDLGAWAPAREGFDLVISLYVHIAGDVEEMVERMANGVAPGGSLLMVGHRPIDPATGKPTAAANQVQVSVEAARAALPASAWELTIAEERARRRGHGRRCGDPGEAPTGPREASVHRLTPPAAQRTGRTSRASAT